jgi:hypothetical protein
MKYNIEYNGERLVIVKMDGDKVLWRRWDGGEPEDNSFGRDYNWVLPELQGLAAEIDRLKEELTMNLQHGDC